MLVADGRASACCEIEFIPNMESEGLPEIWSAMASATIKSVNKGFIPYLETFAENRSFARCVKRALQINILMDDEIPSGSDTEEDKNQVDALTEGPTGFCAHHELEKVCKAQKKPVSFDSLKAAAIKHNADAAPDAKDRIKADPTTWTSFASIEPIDAYLLLGKLEEKNRVVKKSDIKG